MNYGKVGRRRRVLLPGVGSELEAALAPLGFYLRFLSLGAERGVSLTPQHSSDQGVLEEPLVRIHRSVGAVCVLQQSRLVRSERTGQFWHGLGVGRALSCRSGGV